MSPDLAETLARLAEATPDLQDDWWLIGSAAMALSGAAPITVADVDLLVSPRDAFALARRWRAPIRPAAPNPRFRSEVYFQWDAPPVPVDVMAGFHVMTPDGWRPLVPRTRVAVAGVFTPSVAEQLEILALFGREKDHARAALLRPLLRD
ncbi:hypothetical protein [Phenylobacterium sp. J367]|uniref:hypothetical protein n=1 Tax=Phenylobacterium sp. J367 TaxID=2898435 RepID=UPI0021510ECF|nr:hypothetical protein [Phenylobacterium sp. J367]MCR5879155.1 hypothetical protein [Phenylobacterium sp. J367]